MLPSLVQFPLLGNPESATVSDYRLFVYIGEFRRGNGELHFFPVFRKIAQIIGWQQLLPWDWRSPLGNTGSATGSSRFQLHFLRALVASDTDVLFF